MRKVSYCKNKDRIKFEFLYNPNITRELENIGCNKISTEKYEIRPFSKKLLNILKFINKWGFEIDSSFEKLLEIKFKLSNFNFKTFSNKNRVNIPLKNKIAKKLCNEVKLTYRDFQLEGISYMVEKKKSVNGDDVGLGKTCQSIGSVMYLDAFPSIVICPNYLKINWKREWEKWTNKTIYIIQEPLPYKLIPQADVYIVNYKKTHLKTRGLKRIFREDLKKLNFKSAIVDESHYLKNHKTQRYRAINNILKKIEYKFLLTATFSLGSPKDVIDQLKLIDRYNDLFPKNINPEDRWETFVTRYCNGYLDKFGWNCSGYSNLSELHEKLRQNCYIRREQSEVASDIPEKETIEVYFDLDNRNEYEKANNDLLNYVEENYGIDKAESASNAEGLTKIVYLRDLIIKGKLSSIYAFIDSFLESSKEKLVVFGVRRDPLIQLAEFYKSDLLIGGINPEEKQKRIDNFQKNKENRLIFINIVDGITLTEANNFLFIEEPIAWKEYQAVGRIKRIGQKNKMRVYISIANDTLDEKIREVNIVNLKVMEAFNKGKKLKDFTKQISLEKELFRMYSNKENNLDNK